MAAEKGVGSARHTGFVTIISAVSALAGLLFGYDTGVISGARLFFVDQFHLTHKTDELVTGAALLGCLIGALIGGKLADIFGRRKVLIWVAVLFVLGAIGTAFAQGPSLLGAGRIVVGIAIGIASFTAPLYISEISPANVRGTLVSLNQLMITIGILVSYLADRALAPDWRWMFGVAAIPALIMLIGLFFVPESPRWYMRVTKVEAARVVLAKIRSAEDVEAELIEIRDSLNQQKGSWRELLSPAVAPALVIGIGLAIFQQITGINTVIYYAPKIFQIAGMHSTDAQLLATAGVGTVNVLMTVVALWLLDRVGRRPLLLWGVVGMVISLGFLGLAFNSSNMTQKLAPVAVGCVALYVACFAISLGPVFWLMISEIYPLKIRGLAMSVATAGNWGSNWVVTVTFLSLLDWFGRAWTFWTYALAGVACWIFVYKLVPETKGKTLEEIEAEGRARARLA
jgi:SP family galactose:H+ symporter-like MFS transporter